MDKDKSDKPIKNLGFSLKIKENKKKEVKKNTLFDAKNFRKPFEEDVVYNDDIQVKEELIKEVEGKKIHPVHEIEEKGPLVIPLIKTNQWRNQESIKEDGKSNKNETETTEKVETPLPSEKEKDQEDKIVEEKSSSIDLKSQYGLQIPVKKRKLNEEDSGPNAMATKVESVEDRVKEEEEEVEDNRTLEEKAIDALKREARMDIDSDGSSIRPSIDAIPILKQNAVPGTENLKSETEKFRHDIQFRPEESTLEDYERIPIEEFGAAMLRGMGWEKGKAVGRNRNKNNAMVEPIEFIPRPSLLGLGAQPVPIDFEEMKKKRKRKTMGKEEPPKEYKPHVTSDGKVRHYRTLDEPRTSSRHSSMSRHRERERERGHDSDSSSRHHRHSTHRSDSDRDRDRDRERERDRKKEKDSDNESTTTTSSSSSSSTSSSSISSSKKETVSYTHSSSNSYTQNRERDHSMNTSTNKHHRSGSSHHRSSHSHSRDDGRDGDRSRSRSRHHHRHQSHSSKSQSNTWLYPNIRVRVVSKSYQSGKYYKKKGVVFDIVRPGECTLRLDSGKLLEEVKERYLETLIPEPQEVVMVVKHTTYTEEDCYQKLGKVLSKDRATEKAMVQLLQTMEIVMLSFDDICEYKGQPTQEFY